MTAGFIVGFDADDEKIFDEQFEFIQAAGLAQAGPAILSPIPSTPLYARLAAEGRLVYDDPAVTFEPRRMSREQLRSGHRRLLERLYEPGAYFERLFRGYRESTAFRERRAALGAIDRPAHEPERPLVEPGRRAADGVAAGRSAGARWPAMELGSGLRAGILAGEPAAGPGCGWAARFHHALCPALALLPDGARPQKHGVRLSRQDGAGKRAGERN